MHYGNPVETLAGALYSATLQDLPEIPERAYMYRGEERLTKSRRPTEEDVEIHMFSEMWGSTALGYGGMGGSSMTSAYTVVVLCRQTDRACIYWGPGGILGRVVDYDAAMRMVNARVTSKSFIPKTEKND